MQLKEEFCTYEALRREHDTQIVQVATEAGLRIAPEQWSSLLYGDIAHKSHMQSIIDKVRVKSGGGCGFDCTVFFYCEFFYIERLKITTVNCFTWILVSTNQGVINTN